MRFLLIRGAKLPHPADLLLESFVKEALSRVSAARYVKDRLLRGEGPSLVSDWSYIVESGNAHQFQIALLRQTDYCSHREGPSISNARCHRLPGHR